MNGESSLKGHAIHFTGIGGVGMSALAHLALDLGATVTGSDIADTANIEILRQRGATITVGHATLSPQTELLIYSSAVPENDTERQQANAAGIKEMRRGDFLNKIALHFPVRIAVSGSHGKTSTTAMIAHILTKCGMAPAFIVGGTINGWSRSGSAGEGNILVTEVDESDGSQANFPATHAVVLNIDDDHSWALGGTAALEECFLSLCSKAEHIITWRASNTERLFGTRRGARLLEKPLAITGLYGEHNRINAAIAAEVCSLLGISAEQSSRALEDFPGVFRRMTEHISTPSLTIVEDYAHHPTELKATLATLREKYPDRKICAIFQPHRMERVERYGAQFAQLLSTCDWCCIVETFGAWRQDGRQADLEKHLTSKINCPFIQLPNTPELIAKEALQACTFHQPALLAVIGAGDISKIVPLLKTALIM